MPTTPNRGWTYPALGANPYFDTIEDFFLAQDTDVQALVTGKLNAIGSGTGTQAVMADSAGLLVRGAPLLVASVIGDSATYANSTAATVMGVITVPAGTLNVVGAVLQVDCRVSVAVASTCNYGLDVLIAAGRIGITTTGSPLPVGNYEASLVASCTTRSTGTSGVIRAGMSLGGTSDPGWVAVGRLVGADGYTGDLTAVINILVRWNMTVADPGNTATLKTMNCWVTYPLATVS